MSSKMSKKSAGTVVPCPPEYPKNRPEQWFPAPQNIIIHCIETNINIGRSGHCLNRPRLGWTVNCIKIYARLHDSYVGSSLQGVTSEVLASTSQYFTNPNIDSRVLD